MAKIIVVFDSLKGSLSSAQANAAVAAALRMRYPDAEVVETSMADGGEGTGEALAPAFDARRLTIRVDDPLGRPVDACFYVSSDRRTAIIDTAAASGLPLIGPEHRDPMITSTYGTGQMIAAAMGIGCRTILLGLGGSASVDCGCGALQALGFRFLDSHGTPVGRGGGVLSQIVSIDSTCRLEGLDKVRFVLFSDVDNPLYGKDGAAYTFGPQKGASSAVCAALEEGVRNFAAAMTFCGYDDTSLGEGAGAAGGMGASFAAILGAEIRAGANAILEAIYFDAAILDASLIITGEGRLDATTLHGKAPFAVLQAARRYNIPVVAVGGSVADKVLIASAGFAATGAATPPDMPLEEALRPEVAADLLAQRATELSAPFL